MNFKIKYKNYSKDLKINKEDVNELNFHESTIANFTEVLEIPKEAILIHESKYSDSKYYFDKKNNDIYRQSDHWGYMIRSCDWFLNNNFKYVDYTGVKIGKCNLKDFTFKKDISNEIKNIINKANNINISKTKYRFIENRFFENENVIFGFILGGSKKILEINEIWG